jgi:membrane carboxypeptidase/penicillin-binding protein PbpC
MNEALVRSLNLPAVQVLEAYGPKKFAATLRNAGLPLKLPEGAEPNLSLILGGQAPVWRISPQRIVPLRATARPGNYAFSQTIR